MGVLKVLAGIFITIGLIIFVGAVGYDDFHALYGVACPISHTITKMLIGFAFIIPGVCLNNLSEK